MFPDAAKEPFEHTRKLIQKIAPQLKAMPYRLSIVGHTASSKVPPKPDTDPLFPDDPYMSPNRRVTITLMREEPPLPDNLTP